MYPAMHKALTCIMSVHLNFTTFLNFTLLLKMKKLELRKNEQFAQSHAASQSRLNLFSFACNIYDLNHLPHYSLSTNIYVSNKSVPSSDRTRSFQKLIKNFLYPECTPHLPHSLPEPHLTSYCISFGPSIGLVLL